MKQEKDDSLIHHNLSVLESYGVHYTNLAYGAISVLQEYYGGDIELTEEQVKKFIDIIANASKRHKRLLEMSRADRMSYADDV